MVKRFVKHALVPVGKKTLDGFRATDNWLYVLSQTQAAETIGENERNFREFLKSKWFKDIWGEEFTPAIFEIDPSSRWRGQSRINGIPLDINVLYWTYRTSKGNKEALKLTSALAGDSLKDRFRLAFGDQVITIAERNKEMTQYVERLEAVEAENKRLKTDLQWLSEDYAQDDHKDVEIKRLRRILRLNCIDPEAPENYI
ncbi:MULTISPECIES: hypothetical protein [Moorena]|uniref:Uncharacterized protein n=1 Tax=Moorena producens 3L TaxID=489825 RepID=F4XW74_9CYAN|nr:MULTISPECIES: hypothetical protein [Moorena]NEQ15373.1 hypothetical protein [Moorena sp. SIO3E2]EGJ31059.1 hypothetical protein LYNGBM3L_42790 [Moorena producens 3L]NEP35532.1 hypothetical protein [Moorena sp. SIO3B2]NEP67926.1 hypothetical protein [Moorena sp. SIO3A5]NEQ09292.1 hypothetical protein [Moorena sp. SIO4E2]